MIHKTSPSRELSDPAGGTGNVKRPIQFLHWTVIILRVSSLAKNVNSGRFLGAQPAKIMIANRVILHSVISHPMSAMLRERILVVDDDANIRSLLTVLLEDEGYQVLTAGDGEAAITTATAEHPDLILLDIRMPKMDGLQVCDKLRTNPETHGIPVIFLTGFNTHDRLELAMEMGGDDFLGKPINAIELRVRIRAMLQTRSIPGEMDRLGEYIKTVKALREQVTTATRKS